MVLTGHLENGLKHGFTGKCLIAKESKCAGKILYFVISTLHFIPIHLLRILVETWCQILRSESRAPAGPAASPQLPGITLSL